MLVGNPRVIIIQIYVKTSKQKSSSSSPPEESSQQELRSHKGRAKTRSGRPLAFPLPVIAGLDDQPANSWKRLACGHDKDDADTDWTQTTCHRNKTNTSHLWRHLTAYFRTCDARLLNMRHNITASLWSTHLELASDTSCWWTKGLDWGWSREVRRSSSLKGT